MVKLHHKFLFSKAMASGFLDHAWEEDSPSVLEEEDFQSYEGEDKDKMRQSLNF